MRAAVYTRLSEADDRSTYERQREDCEATVTAKRLTYTPSEDWFTDYGRSAWQPDVRREAFETMLDAVKAGRYQAIVAWKVDRLCRSHRDLSRITDLLDRHGASLILVTEGLDASTPMGRFGLEILTSAASLESANTSLRVASAQKHMVQGGRNRGGPRPYGWQPGPHPTGQGSWLYLDPDEAPVVREIVDRLLAGESARSVAHVLNDKGVPTRKGGRWTDATVLGIVRSPRMVGWQPYTPGRKSASEPAQIARDNDGEPIPAGEPMLDRATWQQLCDELSPTTRGPGRTPGQAWLSGLARCALCDAPMHSNAAPPKGVYLCSARRQHGTDATHQTPVTIRTGRLQKLVDGAVSERVRLSDFVPPEQQDADYGRAVDLRAKLDMLDDQWADGILDDRRHARLAGRLQAELEQVERLSRRTSAARAVDVVEWDGLGSTGKRTNARKVLTAVRVQPAKVEARTEGWRVRLEWVDGKRSTWDG